MWLASFSGGWMSRKKDHTLSAQYLMMGLLFNFFLKLFQGVEFSFEIQVTFVHKWAIAGG
jgi:hypothetical protein